MLIRDMVDDLAMFTVNEVDQAIKTYRRDAGNRFFPTSGQLREPILAARKDTQGTERISARPLSESRPLLWWYLNRKLWKSHWREADIPGLAREKYEAWERAAERKGR